MSPFAFSFTKAPTILDEATRRVGVIASTESVDEEGDIIRQAGWILSRVDAGQVKLLNSHKQTDIRDVLGNVEVAVVRDRALHTEVTYAFDNPLADMAWKMTLSGVLKGYSVGYRPRAVATVRDIRDADGKVVVRADRNLWDMACKEMGLDPKETADRASRIILRAMLGELSACAAPVNPDAMVKALGCGALREEDFAAAGFAGSHTFDFIQKGAAAWDCMSPEQRENFSEALTGISRHHLQTKGIGTATADKAQRERAEAENQRRDELLETCKALASKFEQATRQR